ncbi:hypothetical protein [Cognatiluteimonas profundi]|nr:hypothetical protein [Lysobacter profundi]
MIASDIDNLNRMPRDASVPWAIGAWPVNGQQRAPSRFMVP